MFVTVSTGNIATGQISVGATATQIVPNRNARGAITIINHGTTAIYLGADANVLTTTGALLSGAAGASFTIQGSAAVWGITASGSQTVGYLETY